jgi:hypothetical protein
MLPYGEGVNLAMLDALELSECLTSDDSKNIQTAIATYEKAMRTRAAEEARNSMEAGSNLFNDWPKVVNFETAIAFYNATVALYGATIAFYSAPLTFYSASLTFYDSSKANCGTPVTFYGAYVAFFSASLRIFSALIAFFATPIANFRS